MRADARGVPVSAGRAESMQSYELALRQFQSYVGDAVATLDAALAEDPEFIGGQIAKALILYTIGERKYVPAVRECLAAAAARVGSASEREVMLMQAVRELADGEWHAACRTLDRVLIEHPRDALNLRNRVTRVLPHWDASMPGYSYVLGMHAFGLEEMNQYAQAEEEAQRALSLERRDGWAVHAATHVMEMQGRIADGVQWLTSREADWAPDNAFAFHNWWHLALFYLDGAQYREALSLFDRAIHPERSPILLMLVDASALLWRLYLEKVDVGGRFEGIADEWEAQLEAEAGFYPFNDWHAAKAFAATGRERPMSIVRQALQKTAQGNDVPGMRAREVGVPLVAGIAAFARGDYRQAIEHIEPMRDTANRFGGSHAQRDAITLTLIEASIRAGDKARARHFLAERQMLKSAGTRWGERLAARVAQ